ncbi:hypothetical protein RB195_016067 [Necator americanus]|uniref:Uncharacterized protein n=1 Tax=Necator americanus TaxID=51031 RepID=A0ABR1E7N7_NECAM
MLGGRNICFYILVLYVLSGAFGLRCYIGRFFEVIKSTTASEKFCAVYIALDCTGGPSGYFDRGYADGTFSDKTMMELIPAMTVTLAYPLTSGHKKEEVEGF